MSGAYVPLWCKSNFTFLEGASHPEELVRRCRQLGVTALVLADRDGVHGVVRAHVETAAGQAAGTRTPRLIVGSQITVAGDPDDPAAPTAALLLLAQSRAGYANLCRLISTGRLRCAKGECRVGWQEVAERAGGLIALWEGRDLLAAEDEDLWRRRAALLKEAFRCRLYGLVTRHRLPDDQRIERRLTSLCRGLALPLAAATEVLYHHRGRRPLQDVVTCIRHRTTLNGAGTLLRANGEHDLKSPRAFARLFADRPELVAATCEIADRCPFSLADLRYRYPSERLPAGHTSAEWLRSLTFSGARARYGGEVPAEVAAQLDTELAVIDELDYCGYFLTMYELVRFCREQGILCQGRGSAANSAADYSLGITAIAPVSMRLLFERFLSRERAEPPDIDLDIGHRRREEAIQFMYRKYGREHAAMVANVIRYRGKSAVRDVGKTLGLPATSLDRVARLVSHHGSDFPAELAGALAQAGLDPQVPVHRLLIALTDQIRDAPRHLSIHPGGFLLGSEPVTTLVPIENAAMEGRTVIQWDKYDVEALGLFKVDLLGLGALTHLDLAFALIRRHYGRSYSMATVPFEDPAVYDMISRGDTVGVFQIESRAQMSMLPRLRPRTFYDLVIEVAIVRPGPITGGMVHPYLRRRSGEEPVEYPHPALRPVLEKTLGVPLFQEQVMKLAVVAADYTPGEADQLRRDMAAWRRSGSIEKHGQKLISRMEAKGISREFAERVFDQIRGFGEYGFPESHAASFALVAYLTAWLKRHYHDVFTAALLNAWPMGFYAPATIVDDARRHGVEVRPVDVTRSDWYCTLEPVPPGLEPVPPGAGGRRFAVRMGLRFVKGLAEAGAAALVAARAERPFTTLEELQARAGLPRDALRKLAESGALGSLIAGPTAAGPQGDGRRRSSLWRVLGARSPDRREDDRPLEIDAPDPKLRFAPLDHFGAIAWDYAAAGHSTRGHPLEPFRDQLARRDLPDAGRVAAMEDGRRVSYAGLVICRQRPGTASGVVFMTLEDEAGFVNLVVWPKVFQRYRPIILTTSFLGVSGRVQARHDVVHIVAERFWKAELPVESNDDRPGGPLPRARQTIPLKSRDFH
ncbi:MAG: error-prone DNA polymerase [Spirochaetaceae bacterium]|nr:error-prone DNA polymerase [Spirochaetaceae bacterium]